MSSGFSIFTSLRYDVNLRQVPSKGIEHAGWNYHNESPLYMLDYHRDRLLRAVTHWKWEKAIEKLSGEKGLQSLAEAAQDAVGPGESEPLRLRITVTQQGEISFEQFKTPASAMGNLFPETLPAPGTQPSAGQPQVPPLFTVVVDEVKSSRSEYTHFKTTNRAVYDEARTRAGIGSTRPAHATEVLITSEEDHFIMEGSITTPYFWRGGRWVTPPVSRAFSREHGSGGNDGTTRRWALERGLAVEQEIKADELVDGEDCYISNGVGGFRAGVVSLGRSS
ncbi:hypothetical protein E4U43_001288 [Claviceps pusilla]|uniref:Aminotransferase, class IV n=1 Tax=Claviceps pusilla TaxID=123648 RepID=A0A9P7N984_9HYPO|nr:hypothetical protein E4U43_001288 [Claviceps pusilla]